MNKIVWVVLGLMGSVFAQAQTLTGIEVKPVFLSAQCKSHDTDNVGTLGLFLNDLSSTQTEDTITLTANSSLFVCTVSMDGKAILSWRQVNPFQGFEAQYYDHKTNSIQMRKVFIDPEKPYNKIKLMGVTYSSSKNFHAIVSEGVMKEDSNQTLSGQIELKKSTLLNAADIEALNAGKAVRKTVEFYHVSNLTSLIDQQELEHGNEVRSAQNLFLHFKKDGNQIRLFRISE